MTVTKIKRLVNPHRPRKKNFSAKQIKAGFGGKRRLAAFKSKRKNVAKHRPAKRNPAHIVTLGLMNPERPRRTVKKTKSKGTKKMAATRKQLSALRKARAARARMSNPSRKRRTRRATAHRSVASNPRRRRRINSRKRNSTRIYVMPKRNGRRHARRNPDMFGMKGMAAGKAILAGLAGVYATKTITPMVASAAPTVASSPIISAIIAAGIAWGGGMLLSKWDKTAGEGFMFGGLMQAGSQLLNLVVPSNPLALSGLGDWVSIAPTGFPVPSNDIRRAMLARGAAALPAPSSSPTTLAGMGAAAMFR